MNSVYNGQYPGCSKSYSLATCGVQHGFGLFHRENRIEDYRMTSLVCKNHFGNFEFATTTPRFYLAQLFGLFISPHYIIWQLDKMRKECAWMWHVGGIEKKIDPTVSLRFRPSRYS
jgi:hypothetical protein